MGEGTTMTMQPAQFGDANGVNCDNCGEWHPASYSHDSPTQGPINEVVCTKDNLSDFYTNERLTPKPKKMKMKTAKRLGLELRS